MKARKTITVDAEAWDRVAAFLKMQKYTRGMSGLLNQYLKQVDSGIKDGFFSTTDDEEAREYLISKLK